MSCNVPVPPSLGSSPSNPLISETSQAPEGSLLAMHLLLEDSGTEPRFFVMSSFLEVSFVFCSAVYPGVSFTNSVVRLFSSKYPDSLFSP